MKRLLLVALLLPALLGGQVEQSGRPSYQPSGTHPTDGDFWGGAGSGGGGTPGAPQNLQIVAQGPESVLLTWDPPADTTGLVGYEVYRNTITPVALTGATHFASTSLQNRYAWDSNSTLQDWYYTVVAVNDSGVVGATATEVNSTTAHENSISGPIRGEYPRVAQSDVFFWPGQIPDVNRLERKDYVDHWGNHANDIAAADDYSVTWVPWYDKTDPEVLYDNILANGTFDNATGWTLGSGWTISGGTLNIDGTNGTSATYTLASNLTDWIGATVRVKYEITTYTSGSGRVNTGGQNGVAESTAATHYEVFFFDTSGSSLNIEFESNGSWNCSIDNVEVDVINVGYGDSWYRSDRGTASSTIVDTTEINWDSGSLLESDWALEFRMSVHDLSVDGTWWDNYGAGSGDRSIEIGTYGTGLVWVRASSNGSTQTERTFASPRNINDNNEYPGDGFDCPFWFRLEFDYDDGGGNTRMRIGYSASRNRHDGWHYDTWETYWTSAEIFDGTSNIYIGSQQTGSGAGWGMQMWGWALYGDLDESNTTPLYSSSPWEMNHGGGGNVTINVDNTNYPSSLVTRPHSAYWRHDNSTLSHDATYSTIEGNTWFNFAAINETGTSQARSFNRVNSGVEFGHYTDGSADGFARVDDNTTDVSTTSIAFDANVPEVYSISIDRTNDLLWYSQSGVAPVSADISSVTNMDTGLATSTMSILRRSMTFYAVGRIPSAFIDSTADANNVLSSLNFELPGRRGINDLHRAALVGSAATPVTPSTDKMAYNTYILTFNHYDGWASKGIQEIELFSTANLSGTPISRNTDIDQDTRTQFPAVMSHFFDHTDVNLTTNVWEWSEMIDGDTLTVYTPPSTASGHATSAGNSIFYVFLPTAQRVRSFRILYDATTDTNPTAQVRLFGWNRDGTGEPFNVFREDVSSGSSTYSFQNILMADLNALNIHTHPDLDI